MEQGGLLLHSQQPSICPYPEPEEYSPCNPFQILVFILIL